MPFRPVLCLVAAVIGFTGAASTSRAADFFEGKTIVTLHSAGTGNASDQMGRSIARYMPKYIKGSPNMIVQSMPGAGGVTLSNHLYNVAPKDGTTIAILNQALGTSQIFGEGAKYETNKFEWIGRVVSTTGLVFVHKNAPAKTLEDMKTQELLFSSSGKGSQTYFLPTLMNKLLGLKTKVILGYQGVPEQFMAMERGEIHGRTGDIVSVRTSNAHLLTDGTLRIIGEFSLDDTPTIPGVPLLMKLPGAEQNRQILELIGAYTAFGFPYATPPGIPRDRLEILRTAFQATMKDPEFLAEMQKFQLDVRPEPAAYLEKIAAKFADVPPDVVAKVKAAME